MSNTAEHLEQNCHYHDGCGTVELVIQPMDRDLGGFSVRRVLPNARRNMVGPWIFFDHMGPATFAPNTGIDVRPHPHIGIATATYLFEGEMLHRDSLGNEQIIRPGDLNLMVCGRGMVHSERQREEIKAQEQDLHALQLWLALPEAQEEIDPAFYHYPQTELPSTTVNDVPLRVMMGSAYGLTSPVKTYAETLYVEAELQAGQQLRIPDAPERGIYVAAGEIQVGDTVVSEHSLAVLSGSSGTVIKAKSTTRIAIIGGEPLGKRFVEWNFVSSNKERIEQAKRDWAAGHFATVPGDDKEFIPLPE